jgi:hypothetical protein
MHSNAPRPRDEQRHVDRWIRNSAAISIEARCDRIVFAYASTSSSTVPAPATRWRRDHFSAGERRASTVQSKVPARGMSLKSLTPATTTVQAGWERSFHDNSRIVPGMAGALRSVPEAVPPACQPESGRLLLGTVDKMKTQTRRPFSELSVVFGFDFKEAQGSKMKLPRETRGGRSAGRQSQVQPDRWGSIGASPAVIQCRVN